MDGPVLALWWLLDGSNWDVLCTEAEITKVRSLASYTMNHSRNMYIIKRIHPTLGWGPGVTWSSVRERAEAAVCLFMRWTEGSLETQRLVWIFNFCDVHIYTLIPFYSNDFNSCHYNYTLPNTNVHIKVWTCGARRQKVFACTLLTSYLNQVSPLKTDFINRSRSYSCQPLLLLGSKSEEIQSSVLWRLVSVFTCLLVE